MWWNFLLKISRNFDLFQLPDRKNLTFIQHLRASTHFVTIITTSDGFSCQFHINLDIFSWMLDFLIKNWNLFQSFCFTLYPNLKNFSVLLKARTKRNWTFEDFQVSMWSQLYLLTLLRCHAAGNSNCRRSPSAKTNEFWGKFLIFNDFISSHINSF